VNQGQPEAIRAVPVRHPGRWVAAVAILVVAAQLVHGAAANPSLHWSVVSDYLFDTRVIHGVEATLYLTVIAMVMGVVLGIVLAVARLSKNPVVSGGAWLYIWFFRGTPVLVQIFIWFYLPTVVHSISIGVPFGPSFVVASDSKTLITQLVAACLGLGLNEAAYMAEIARAGILSVDEGQVEAASALGMTRLASMRRIVLPQAMRVIIPPTGNETISMLKTTSLVSVIGYGELFFATSAIASSNFQTIALLIVASAWYIFWTTLLSIGQYYLERRFARGALRDLPPTPFQRLRRMLGRDDGRRDSDPPPGPITGPISIIGPDGSVA